MSKNKLLGYMVIEIVNHIRECSKLRYDGVGIVIHWELCKNLFCMIFFCFLNWKFIERYEDMEDIKEIWWYSFVSYLKEY